MNSLGINISNKHVVIQKKYLLPEFHPIEKRVCLVTGGFGALQHTIGSALFVTWIADGGNDRLNSAWVERLATDEEVAAAKTAAMGASHVLPLESQS